MPLIFHSHLPRWSWLPLASWLPLSLLRKLGVTAEPEIVSQILKGDDYAFIISFSDGIGGVLSDQEIVDLCRGAKHPSDATKAVLNFAEELGSDDNCTVLCIPLKGWGKVAGNDSTKEEREKRRSRVDVFRDNRQWNRAYMTYSCAHVNIFQHLQKLSLNELGCPSTLWRIGSSQVSENEGSHFLWSIGPTIDFFSFSPSFGLCQKKELLKNKHKGRTKDWKVIFLFSPLISAWIREWTI